MDKLSTVLTELQNFELDATDLSDNRENLNSRIFRALTPNRIRIDSMDNNLRKMLEDKINSSVSQNLPITMIVGMGWGKNFHSYSAPHANWAEFLHFQFLYSVFGKISKIYEPGVRLEITPDQYAVRIINNYKQEWLDSYQQDFNELLNYFDQHTPQNYKMVFRDTSEWYDYDKLETEINDEAAVLANNVELVAKLTQERFHNAENNVVIDEDMDDETRNELIRKSILMHKAWLDVDYKHRAEYLEGGHHIPIAHRKGIPGTYNLRSFPSSIIQFWKGDGIFMANEGYRPHIMSPNQWQAKAGQIELLQNASTIDLSFLKEIPVLN